MALSPLKPPSERAVQVTRINAPSKTYALDFDTGEIGGYIDGRDAVKQFVRKALSTARFRFLIYNANYGCELETLIGEDIPSELLQTEVTRIIREALIYDDRIRDVKDFAISRQADGLYVSFTVDSVYGAIAEGVTV